MWWTERVGLATRLVLLGALFALLVSAVSALVLGHTLHGALMRSHEDDLVQRSDRLAAELLTRVARGQDLSQMAGAVDPNFDIIFSGWYWQLGRGADAMRSRSLWDSALELDRLGPDAIAPHMMRGGGPRGEPILGMVRMLNLPDGVHALYVFGPAHALDAEIDAVDRVLLTTPIALVIVLVALTLLQVRLGLAPLRRLQQTLSHIRGGDAERIGGGFGPDLLPVAREIDAVLDRNQQIIERGRNHAANLGHALKKPLAILALEARHPSVDSSQVKTQVAAISSMIDRHLVRSASGAGNVRWIGVGDVLSNVMSLVEHIHVDRGLRWQSQLQPGLRWKGETTDLEEMVGNLLDNAGKWACSWVRLSARRDGARLLLEVEDDGPGLTSEQMGEASRRGSRFDESVEGSGLGLAIVDDLARTYGGRLTIEPGAAGGLCCRLDL